MTRVEQVADFTGGSPDWVMVATADYDTWGRIEVAGDALGRETTTTYVHNNNDLLGTVITTNPAGHETTVTLDTTRGLPTSAVDANDKTTTAWLDALGRLTHVWAPERGPTDTPDTEYVYTVSLTAPATIQTKTLSPTGGVVSAFDISDGLLRPRQTQATAPDGKRTIVDTRYDGRGLPVKTSTFYNNASAPTGTLVGFADTAVDTQTRTVYDGAGRPIRDQFWSADSLQWETITGYGGDRVTVTPPAGGTPTTTLTDVRGRLTHLRQHDGATTASAFQETSYGYNLRDELTSVTDPADNQWTYDYDLLGRRWQTIDPDAGTSTSVYDNAGQLVTTTDGRGETLWYGYDTLGRPTELRDDNPTGTLRASWLYDTLGAGLLTSSSRHVGADTYTSTVTAYDDGYRPLGTTVTIPAAETGLAGTYTTSHSYHDNGAPETTTIPAVGGLPAETIEYGYHTASGLPTTLTTENDTYVAATSYHYDGQIAQRILGTGADRVRVSSPVEPGTRRLAASQIDTEHQTTPNTWDDAATTTYTYDPAGNITSMAGETAGVADQTECFTYDNFRRLTDAWTQTTTPCTNPQRTGADPYRQQWEYDDATGNRETETTWTATGSTTATYTYPTPTNPQPHAVTEVDYIGETTRTDTFTYTTGGHTDERTVDGVTQTHTYNPEGRLAATTQTGLDTTYVYDTSGNRLLRRDDTGTTLYLGHTELRRTNANGQIDGTRYYHHNGATVAVRTVTGLTWLVPDHHGTHQIAIDPTTLDLTHRRTLPFGNPRTTPPPAGWPGDKGFLGGTQDPTGLTHIGARLYDPAHGRFTTVDPLMDLTDPQQMNGYAYANNNPTTFSDPTGLYPTADNDGHLRSYDKNKVHGNPPKYASPDKFVPKTIVENERYEVEADGFGQVLLNGYPVPPGGPDAAALVGYLAEHCHGDQWCYGDFYCGNTLNCDPAQTDVEATIVLLQICEKGYCSNDFRMKVADDNIFLIGIVYGMFDGVGVVSGGGKRRGSGFGAGTGHRLQLSACKNSFIPGTPVLMADGTTKPIEQVEVGDTVLATDPETGETAPKQVTDTITGNGEKNLVAITIQDNEPTATIVATDKHPFWIPELNEWVDAADLVVGQLLRTAAGTHVQITAIRAWNETRTVHNLTIADIHTYYVMSGDTPVLVHNCGGSVQGHPSTCACASGGVPQVRNGALAGSAHPVTGIPFDRNGFPDFSSVRHPSVPDVRITLSGNRSTDFARANRAAGLSSTPTGYTWHHHQDKGLMQLVDRTVHAKTGHTGGFK
ncbi:polymorphic toxin-type HINT domain-containing protein [Solwaraspora sp. WMMD406]|uniref:polymorphic toxin-type HINT domain-containing protein n=1 Tax=Solwaraspora sp. WMMD406 TaxID=3016095 RepID=UPI002415B7F0|nr:polymorphic toxin-type HINT domain-containing protein [Solwaraspora sp. WMMD406]MDG4762729.1 polymorphic toxin-type HINT domain-containing protein [Solwaraspora sp. WMMD406]